jgi:hypothetical protein
VTERGRVTEATAMEAAMKAMATATRAMARATVVVSERR